MDRWTEWLRQLLTNYPPCYIPEVISGHCNQTWGSLTRAWPAVPVWRCARSPGCPAQPFSYWLSPKETIPRYRVWLEKISYSHLFLKYLVLMNVQNPLVSGPITSWEIDGETVSDFIFLGSKITTDGDCSHEVKRRLLLGRKVTTNLDRSRRY